MPADRSNDFDVQVPPWLLHVWPVVIGLLFLVVTLANYSVYEGFSETETATRFNIVQITFACVLCLAAARNRLVEAATRKAAWVLGVVCAFALIDETFSLHEEIGYWVQDHVEFLPGRVTHFTDDVIILGGAFVGGYLLYRLIRATGRARDLAPYAASVFALAVAHGVLDIISHGTVTLKVMFPEAPRVELKAMEDRLSAFEEFCKIWAVWFVVLFGQRFFHRSRVSLAWSWLLCTGSVVAALSLWQLGDPATGVPYIRVGGTLELIRNFHAYAELCLVWSAFAIAGWFALRDREEARPWFGLLFPLSAVALAGGWSDPRRVGAWISGVADALLANAYWDADFWAYSLLALLFVGPGAIAGLLMWRAVRRGRPGVVGYAVVTLLVAALLGRDGGFVAVCFAVGVLGLALAHRGVPRATVPSRAAAIVGTLVVCAILLAVTLRPMIPNRRFSDDRFEFFRMRVQPLDTESDR